MVEEDRKQFLSLIADVYAFYQRDFSVFAGNIWWRALREFDLSSIEDAIGRHCVNPDSGQYMPRPADVVKMFGGSSQDAALVAWSKVDKAVRQVGTYQSVVFDDPLIHRVLHDMGGWIPLGIKTEHEWPFVAKEFENRYRGYRMRSDHPEYPRSLIGIAEAENKRNGMPHYGVTIIGLKSCAQRVFDAGTDRPLLGLTSVESSEMLQQPVERKESVPLIAEKAARQALRMDA